jgi:MFS family permease
MCTELIGRWIDHRIIRLGPEPRGSNSAYVLQCADRVVSSYTITFAAFILTAGALGDRIGAKRIFMAEFAIVTVASLACALAPTAIVLFAARSAMQELGALSLFRTRWRCSATLIPMKEGAGGR